MTVFPLRLLVLSMVFNLASVHAAIIPPVSSIGMASRDKAEVQDPEINFAIPECANQNWASLNNAAFWNEAYWWNNALQTNDLCEETTDLCITVTNACSGGNVHIEYLLFLDLDNNGTLETVVNSMDTTLGWNKVLYNNANTPNFTGGLAQAFDERVVADAEKYGFALQQIANDTQKIACVRWNTQLQPNNFVFPELPHGTHKIKWFITDDCGTNLEYEYTFTVKDCQAPTVVCRDGLSANLSPSQTISFLASSILQYTEDNCSLQSQIKLGIRKCGTGTGFPLDAQGNPNQIVTFDCIGIGTQCVELWAMDSADNAGYCFTFVTIIDPGTVCDWGVGSIDVKGILETPSLEGIGEAIVNITGDIVFGPPFFYFGLTNTAGNYSILDSAPFGSDITITPEKEDNPLNGVTTFDLVLISKHILGLEPLNSPFKMIAADANKSGSITTFDIVELRKLILGIYTELPNNNSWRFVDKVFSFPNLNNPFQTLFPEKITAQDVDNHLLGKDFVGLKVGDVNNTAVPNAQMQAEERTFGTATFDVSPILNGAERGDREVKLGEIFEVNFKAAEELEGFQFTMLLDGLEMIGLTNTDQVNASNFGQFEGATTVSINGSQEFTLQFRATKSGKLSNMLGVSSSITRAEAYGKEGRKNIAFRYEGNTIAGMGFELYQNQPNPFVNKTNIGFYLPEASEATLSVFEQSGRVVYEQKGQFAKGENMIALDRALLNTTGAMYYKLETATDSATRKMIQAK